MTSRAARRLSAHAASAACLAITLGAATARAQPVDPTMRGAARKIAGEAIELFDQARYGEALEKFELANRLTAAPTLGLRAARCLAKLGRLIEASQRYLEVTQTQLAPDAPEIHFKAQRDAAVERGELLLRIPNLYVTIRGPLGAGVTVSLDDRPLPPELVGSSLRLNPGRHVVVVQRADAAARGEVELTEGGQEQLALTLPPLPAPPVLLPATPPRPAPKPPAPRPSPLEPAGWTAVGFGAAGAAIGIGNAIAAIRMQSALLERCADRRCPPAAYDDADLYDTTRVISTAGFVVGAVGLAAGVTLLVLAPAERRQPRARGPRAHAAVGASAVARGPRLDLFVTWRGASARGIF